MDTVVWRARLHPDFRQRQLNIIMNKLQMHHPFADVDQLLEIQKSCQSFEHKTCAEAICLMDYLHKISLMMISIERIDDWKVKLQPGSRQRIVGKIVDTLKTLIPVSGQEGLDELRKIAGRYEDKVYTTSIKQSDYFLSISSKMLAMKAKGQNAEADSMPSNPGGSSNGKRIRRQPTWFKDYNMAED